MQSQTTDDLPDRVLFLEDQVLIAMDTSEYLSELGIKDVRVVHTLDDAKRAIAAERFDLAILDINVDRDQQSYDLGAELLQSGVPVVFASGTEVERSRLCEEGYRFLPKPYELTRLREMVLETGSTSAGRR